jgi:alpha,alpha-trehalose phosphorylase
MFFAPEAFTPEQKAANFAYYEELTVRDSSLSAAVQAVIAAEVGQLDLAADYLAEAATLDLDDLHDNTDEGLHMASLAGIWTALTCGFGGMRDSDAGMRFAPRLPPQLTRIAFGIKLAGHTLRLDVRPDATTYRLSDGPRVTVHHFGEPVELEPGHPLTLPTPKLPDPGPRPSQPKHRAPRDFAEALGG